MNFKKTDERAFTPVRGHSTDAGLDLKTPINFQIRPMEIKVIDIKVAFELPENSVGLVKPRSKLGKIGLQILGGVIDEGYTGSIAVTLINLGQEAITFNAGNKIAQFLVMPVLYPSLTEVTELKETERGAAGIHDKDVRL